MNSVFWKNKKVFITGHTGFKGSWLVMMLKNAGANVAGYSIDIPTNPSMFELCDIKSHLVKDYRGDICNHEKLNQAMNEFSPEIVFHLAAQPLVRLSYNDPFTTYQTNVMGTLSVLMSCNHCPTVTTIINITTDKCYDNKEWEWGYREIDPIGGYDPYSSSKGCAEILSASIRKSFLEKNNKRMATVRAGNVIGGGDFAEDRIIPDFIRTYEKGIELEIRNPQATRPWQHVMEPLNAYMVLAEKLYADAKYAEAWNFGPEDEDCRTVDYITKTLKEFIPDHRGIKNIGNKNQPHEANFLKLDCSKAKTKLGWKPKLKVKDALKLTAEWYQMNLNKKDISSFTLKQINDFIKLYE